VQQHKLNDESEDGRAYHWSASPFARLTSGACFSKRFLFIDLN